MPSPRVLPGAEPFYLPGGDSACVLVHGLTGTPREMRRLGESLAAAGHTVLGVRLAGHATQMDDLRRTRWEDWLTSVESGVALVRGSSRRVVLIGLSLGGVLSLLAGSRFPVDGIVAMATPFTPPHPLIEPLRPFFPVLRLFLRDFSKGDGGWQDPGAAVGHLEYPAYPLEAVGQLRDVLAVMRRSLPDLRVPLLLLSGDRDTTAPESNASRILERAGSRTKGRVVVQGSGHVITLDGGRDEAFRLTRDFVASLPQAPPVSPAVPRLMPGAEPFLLRGGRTGCLLVHGFTASPQEMRGLGEHLAGQGHTVLGIRLAGHGTRLEDMARVRWTDWQADVQDGLNLLASLCDRVVLIGLSLGGALSLLEAAGGNVAGVAALSTPFTFGDSPRVALARALRAVVRTIPKGASDFRNEDAGRARVAYPAYPLAGLPQVEAALQAMRAALPRLSGPVLLLHSADDTFVVPENMTSIREHLTGAQVTSELIDGSNHILTCDARRDLVWSRVAAFVAQCTRGAA
jgi:carboxylesterase